MSLRCCPTCRVTWGMRPLTAPTTTFTPLPISWTPTPSSPGEASRCYQKSDSNEARPEIGRPGVVRLRPRLSPRLHAQGQRALAENGRGLPDQPGMFPRLSLRYRPRWTRTAQLRTLRPQPPEGMARLDD